MDNKNFDESNARCEKMVDNYFLAPENDLLLRHSRKSSC